VVGDYESPISEIEHAGIPQWSPLSPILYVFYNANLVQGHINKSEGSIGFIDDYNAWATGPSAADATATKGREVGAGGWRDFRSRQDGLVVAAACSVKII
jgi:hypothetical protein